MKTVKFSLRLESSLACSVEDSFYQEQFVLPGSVMRGAFANLYLSARGKDTDFDNIFISGKNRFPFMFAANANGEPMRKAPKTTAACKRKGKKHGVVSRLNDLHTHSPSGLCHKCNQDIKPFDGYLENDEFPLEKSFYGHTAIHEKTGIALPHAFYREMLISPRRKDGPHFCGYGFLNDRSFGLLREICHSNPLMIGKSRSRGKGWGNLTLEVTNPKPRRTHTSPDDDTFTLHCISPLILLDEFLRPSSVPELKWQNEICELISSEIGMVSIRGWSVVHALPKIEDQAVDMGSVFIFRKTPALKTEENFSAFVVEVERSGLGERKIEGFGEIMINDVIVTDP